MATCSLKPRTDKRHRLSQPKGQICRVGAADGIIDLKCSRCGMVALGVPLSTIISATESRIIVGPTKKEAN